jgi:hypothetical protein
MGEKDLDKGATVFENQEVDRIEYMDVGYVNRVVNGYECGEWLNVFDLWVVNGFKLPFRVKRWSWHPATYFEVKKIKVSHGDWEEFRKKLKFYGEVYGDLWVRSTLRKENMKLENAGYYQWTLSDSKFLDR